MCSYGVCGECESNVCSTDVSMVINGSVNQCKSCEHYERPFGCPEDIDDDGLCRNYLSRAQKAYIDELNYVNSCEDYGYPVDESYWDEDDIDFIPDPDCER